MGEYWVAQGGTPLRSIDLPNELAQFASSIQVPGDATRCSVFSVVLTHEMQRVLERLFLKFQAKSNRKQSFFQFKFARWIWFVFCSFIHSQQLIGCESSRQSLIVFRVELRSAFHHFPAKSFQRFRIESRCRKSIQCMQCNDRERNILERRDWCSCECWNHQRSSNLFDSNDRTSQCWCEIDLRRWNKLGFAFIQVVIVKARQ